MITGPVVIVGAGQAALQLCLSLRQNAYEGDIVMIGDECRYPYQRPPLSKDFLKGRITEDDLNFRPAEFFAEAGVECRLSDAVVSVDRDAHLVRLASGAELAYGHLVFATGARNRVPPIPGLDTADVSGLRTCDDAARLARQLGGKPAVAAIGAGFIGLEFASVAIEKGCDVTVVEAADRAMSRSLSAGMAGYLVEELARAGVTFRFGKPVDEVLIEDGRVVGVKVGPERIASDLVLLCAGVVPNSELAQACGLTCGRGIEVDAMLRTSDPDISAIGDCASFPSERFGARLLLESVQNATGQARFLAARLTGRCGTEPYDDVPWFWSEIAGRKLQIAGASIGADRFVMRGDPASAKFSVFCYAGDRLVAVESINSPADHMTGRKLIAQKRVIPQDRVSDPDFDLKAALV